MQGISNSNVILSYLTVNQDTTLKNLHVTDHFTYPSTLRFPNTISHTKYTSSIVIPVPKKATSVYIECQGPGGNGGNGICSKDSCSGGSGGGAGAYADKTVSLQDIGNPATFALTVNQNRSDTYVTHQPIGFLCFAGAGQNGSDGANPNEDYYLSILEYVSGGNCGQGPQPVYESGGRGNICNSNRKNQNGYGTKGSDSLFHYGAGGGGGGGGGGYHCDLNNQQTSFYGGYGGAVLLNNNNTEINNHLRGALGTPSHLDGINGGGGCAVGVTNVTSTSIHAGNGGDGLEGWGGGGGGSFGYLNDPNILISNQNGIGGKGGSGYIKITFYS